MTEVGSACVCLHVSAFSREEAPLQIKLDKRKRAAGKEKKIGQPLQRLVRIRPELRRDRAELRCTCVGVRIRGCLFSEVRRVYYSCGVRILTGFSLSKTHYK